MTKTKKAEKELLLKKMIKKLPKKVENKKFKKLKSQQQRKSK